MRMKARREAGWSETRTCPQCQAVFVVSGHLGWKHFCSKLCSSRFSGQKKRKDKSSTCVACGRAFQAQRSVRPHCNRQCAAIARRGPDWKPKSLPFRAKARPRITTTCQECGAEFKVKASHSLKTKFCSRQCSLNDYRKRSYGAGNPNYRKAIRLTRCVECGKNISSYKDGRKYCSYRCMGDSLAFREMMRNKPRKDLNHAVIVTAFKQLNCNVLDLSKEGRGIPDLAVAFVGVWHMVEVKNPNSSYGRKGLNKRQHKYNESIGGTVEIVRTVDEVLALVTRWRVATSATGSRDNVPTLRTIDDALALVGRMP